MACCWLSAAGQRVMRVDMVERVAMLVRTAAREGILGLPRTCCHWRRPRRTDGADLLDLNCVVVGEEASEDPEKPALQIFERKRKTRLSQDGRGGGVSKHNGPKAKQGRKGQNQNGKNRNLKPGVSPRPNHKRPAEKQPDPNSPFAVLAALKTKA